MTNRFARFLTGVVDNHVAPVVGAVDNVRTIPQRRESERQQQILRGAQAASARAEELRRRGLPAEDARQLGDLGQVAEMQFDYSNRGADAEAGRTQALERSRAELTQSMLGTAANAAGGLDTTRTSNQIRLANETFEPIRGLAESGMSHDREMARMFIGDTPLINSVNDTALTMQGRSHDLARELNQRTGLEKLVGPLSQIAALAYLFT